MALRNITVSQSTSYANLRVKMAQTVHRRLTERAAPSFPDIAREVAARMGVNRGPDTHTYPDGYVQSRKDDPRHYLDSFSARVVGSPSQFPITLEGSNSAPHARIVEGGRKATTARPVSKSKLLWPGSGGEAAFGLSTTNTSVPPKPVTREALRLAMSRASR